jgi:hypothetical protein
MGKRFRNHRPEGATEPTALPTWYKGKVERLVLCPTEMGGTYFRAGLYIEKESIETIRGDLGERTVTVV